MTTDDCQLTILAYYCTDIKRFHRVKSKDKSDRATAEQVMDKRTRMILFKMLSSGVFTEINGCISTGKEANVYHANGQDAKHLAVKVTNDCTDLCLLSLRHN